MTTEGYQRIVDNQIVFDKKLGGIINELKVIKKDVNTAIKINNCLNNMKWISQKD